jgi:hypothetical protein
MTAPIRGTGSSAPVSGRSSSGATATTDAQITVAPGAWLIVTTGGHASGGGKTATGVVFASGNNMIASGQTTPEGVTQGGAHAVGKWRWRNATGSPVTGFVVATFNSGNTKQDVIAVTWSGLDDATPLEAFTGANWANSASSTGTHVALTVPTRPDDIVEDGLAFSYGDASTTNPTPSSGQLGQVEIGAGADEYLGISYEVATGNSTTVEWDKNYDIGSAYGAWVLRTATPNLLTLGSVNVDIVEAVSGASVGQAKTLRATAKSTSGVNFSGAAITLTGLNSAIATVGSGTGVTDVNGEFSTPITGVSPGALSLGASAVKDSTTVTDPSPLSYSILGGLGGVSVVESPSGLTPTSFSVPEGEMTVGYLISSLGEGATFAKSTGADNARFTVNASSGQIQFLALTDHEDPDDADLNNVYVLGVTATLGAETESATILITVQNVVDSLAIAAPASAASGSSITVTVTEPGPDTVVAGADVWLGSTKVGVTGSSGQLTFVLSGTGTKPLSAVKDGLVASRTILVTAGGGGLPGLILSPAALQADVGTALVYQAEFRDSGGSPIAGAQLDLIIASNIPYTFDTIAPTDSQGRTTIRVWPSIGGIGTLQVRRGLDLSNAASFESVDISGAGAQWNRPVLP